MLQNKLQLLSISVIIVMLVGLIGLPPLIKSTFAAAVAAQAKRPNILLIVGDDFGYSDIGPFGSEIKTPNFDALAKDGKILTDYHTGPMCSTARSMLLTGVDNHIGGLGTMFELIAQNQIGKPGYETWINNRVIDVAEILKSAGYNTFMAGKWHLSGPSPFRNGTYPADRGFEKSLTLLGGIANHFGGAPEAPFDPVQYAGNHTKIPRPLPNSTYSNDLYANKIIDYIKSSTNGKPFFGYLAFQVAHYPFQTPQATVAKYEKIYQSLGWDGAKKQIFENQKKLGFWPTDMKLPQRLPPNVPWTSLTLEQQAFVSRILAIRAAMIENMDQAVGRVVQTLKDTGQYDNTLIIFVSDNGSSDAATVVGDFSSPADKAFMAGVNNNFTNIGNVTSYIDYSTYGNYVGATPLSGFKATQWEAGTRVPFIIKEPMAPGG